MKELARLVGAARSEGRTWSYIESHASPGLSQKIREAAVVHVNYLESPLDCLVQGRRDEFEELIRVQPAMTDGDRYDEAERLLRSFAEHMRQQLSDFEMQQTALLKKK
jgi:glycine cleavage system protein P-like pyridoxal-binding family